MKLGIPFLLPRLLKYPRNPPRFLFLENRGFLCEFGRIQKIPMKVPSCDQRSVILHGYNTGSTYPFTLNSH